MLKSIALLAGAACVHAHTRAHTHTQSADTAPPNAPSTVLFILLDDVGWHDVSYNHDANATAGEFLTPNIDALALSGIRFTQHHAHHMCTPSRSALLSGRLPVHVQTGQAFPETPSSGIPRNMTTIASKFRAAGYSTHVAGKWDVGMATPTHTPEGRGFDSSLIYWGHTTDYYTQKITLSESGCVFFDSNITDLWDSGAPAFEYAGSTYLEYAFRDRMLNVTNTTPSTTPLFMLYASHISHYPFQVPQEYYDKFNFTQDDEGMCNGTTPFIYPGGPGTADFKCRRVKNAMMNLVDDSIGQIISALKQRRDWNSTLVIFSSDNGSPLDLSEAGGSNYPMRGGKYSSFQGGTRVPAFVSGGWLPESLRGSEMGGLMHIADWYATLSNLVGVPADDPVAAAAGLPPPDSLDVMPLILGQNTTSPRVEIPISTASMLSWPYKLLLGPQAYASWQSELFPNASSTDASINTFIDCGSTGCLFNVEQDPTEHTDISASLPNVTAALVQRLNSVQKTFFNNNDTGVNIAECPTNTLMPCGCWAAVNVWNQFLGPYQV